MRRLLNFSAGFLACIPFVAQQGYAVNLDFGVYISDTVYGQHPSCLPPRLMPVPTTTEAQALAVAFVAIESGSVVWKIRRPDGTEILRPRIEDLFRASR
jgi:hypothetical protein